MPAITRQQNLKVSYDFIDWILKTNRGIMGHLYEFTSATGIKDYFTDLDVNVLYNNHLWTANSLRFEGLQRKVGVGLTVDEQTLKVWAAPTDTLFGSVFLPGAEQGLLDGATVVRYRAIWHFNTGNVAADILDQQPLAIWPMFTGYTATITKGGSSHVEMKVKSALTKLNVNMPRNYYQPGCLWTLFDAGCTLVKATFATSAAVGAGPGLTVIPVAGGIVGFIGTDGNPLFAQGRLLFTSGVNNGLQVLIDNNDANNLYLAYALDLAPTTSDTMTLYPGCSKTFSTCETKFNNAANFRGFDKVPPIMLSA